MNSIIKAKFLIGPNVCIYVMGLDLFVNLKITVQLVFHVNKKIIKNKV